MDEFDAERQSMQDEYDEWYRMGNPYALPGTGGDEVTYAVESEDVD